MSNPLENHFEANRDEPNVRRQAELNISEPERLPDTKKMLATGAVLGAIAVGVVAPNVASDIHDNLRDRSTQTEAVNWYSDSKAIVAAGDQIQAGDDFSQAELEGAVLGPATVISEAVEIGKDAPPEAREQLINQITGTAQETLDQGFEDKITISVQNQELTDPNADPDTTQDALVDQIGDRARSEMLADEIQENVDKNPELEGKVDVEVVTEEQNVPAELDQDTMIELELVGSDYGLTADEVWQKYKAGTLDEISPDFQAGVANLIKSSESSQVTIQGVSTPPSEG